MGIQPVSVFMNADETRLGTLLPTMALSLKPNFSSAIQDHINALRRSSASADVTSIS